MATMFFGNKLRPKRPYHLEDLEGRRLHLTQATLGSKAYEKRCIVKCQVEDEPETVICSLKSGLHETVPLDLYFETPVTFSVSGSPVYLCGNFEFEEEDDDYDEDDEDDDEMVDFINDNEEDDEAESDDEEDVPVQRSGVKIVEIESGDEDEAKKAEPEPVKTDNGEKAKSDKPEDENDASEDEDGLPRSGKRKNSAKAEPASKKKKPNAVEVPPTPESSKKKKKKERKEKKKAAEQAEAEAEQKPKKVGGKKRGSRKFPNGLEIEDVEMGKPDGTQAQPGKKVGINYIGKLKSTGAIFDSTVGRKPFRFRLGVNEVVKGLDIGVMGMRIGDKRKITIPPSMGYGAKTVGSIPPGSWLVFYIELVDVKG